MDDQPDVALTRTDQKFLSFALSSLWKLDARTGRVQLQIEGRRLDGLLLVAGQPGEAVVNVSAIQRPTPRPVPLAARPDGRMEDRPDEAAHNRPPRSIAGT